MQPVKIRILSTNSDAQSFEQKYTGTMTAKDGKYYVMYSEDEQSGLANTKTTLKWDDERVIILRSGSVEHRQEFCMGLADKSVYHTPYLDIPMTTHTTYLDTRFARGAWQLQMECKLLHGDEPYDERKIIIEIEEDTEVGH